MLIKPVRPAIAPGLQLQVQILICTGHNQTEMTCLHANGWQMLEKSEVEREMAVAAVLDCLCLHISGHEDIREPRSKSIVKEPIIRAVKCSEKRL